MTFALVAALLSLQEKPTDFLPPDTAAYAEFSNPSALPDAYAKYLGRFAPPKSADALGEKLAAASKSLADEIRQTLPELLSPETMTLALSVDSLHVAVVHVHGTQRWPEGVAVMALRDADAVKAFLKDRIAPKAGETGTLADRRAYRIGGEIWVVGSGRFAVAAKSLRDLGDAIARGEKKSAAPGLESNPLFGRLAAVDAGVPTLRFFIDVPRIVRQQLGDSIRNDAWDAEGDCALMRADRLGGLLGRLTLADGAIRLETRMDGENILSDFIGTQPVSADAWTFVPAGSLVCAGIGVKDVHAFLKKLQSEFGRMDEVQLEMGRENSVMWAQFEEDVHSQFGVKVDEAADAFGGDAVLFVGPLEGVMVHAPDIGFAVRGRDAEQLAKWIDKIAHCPQIVEKAGEFEKTSYKGLDVFHSDEKHMAYALSKEWLLLGDGLDAVKSMIDAHEGDSKFAGYVRALPGGEPLLKNSALFLALNTGAVASAIGAFGVIPGGIGADAFAESAVDMLGFWRDGEATVVGSTGTGLASMIFGVAPLAVVSIGRSFRSSAETPPDPQNVEPRVPPTAEAVDPDPAMPADAAKRDAWIADKISDLNSDDPAKRDDATAALRRAGALASKAMSKAARDSGDEETKARLMMLLEKAGAYDEMPAEIVAATVQRLVSKLDSASIFTWGVEDVPGGGIPSAAPRWVYGDTLQPRVWDMRLKEESVLRAKSSTPLLSESLKHESTARRNVAALLAVYDSAPAEKEIASLLDSEKDKTAALYLRIAVGWGTGDAARKITLDGLASTDEWTRRAAFLAAERRPNAAVVDALATMLDAPDPETRFNAAYTLRRITAAKIDVRPFAPKAERTPAVDAARAWWTSNRAGATLREKTPGGDW